MNEEPLRYSKMIFTDKKTEKEWEEMPENIKMLIYNNLAETAKKMKHELSIQMLCHVVSDLLKRIQKLET